MGEPSGEERRLEAAGTCGTCPSAGSVSGRLVTIGEDFGAGSWAGSMLKRRPSSCSAMKFSLSVRREGRRLGLRQGGQGAERKRQREQRCEERLAMIVSRNDDVQCTCGRGGARAPRRPAARCGGTPASAAKASAGKGGGRARRACHRLFQPPCPRPSPQVTSEATYCILRRMSTDEHGAP